MLISKAKAAREIGISKQRLSYYFENQKKAGIEIKFLKENENGNEKVDNEHPDWLKFKKEYKTKVAPSVVSRKMQSNTMKRKSALKKKMNLNEEDDENSAGKKKKKKTTQIEDSEEKGIIKYTPEEKQKISILEKDSYLAGLRKEIFDSKIKEEKAKQEEIRTLERKKEVAPIDLLKHYFSWEENVIQRIYRRPHEILPQLKTLLLAHQDIKAEQLLVRELEGIMNDSHKELLLQIKEDGFKIKKLEG